MTDIATTSILTEVLGERKRQIEAEGHSHQQDDSYVNGELPDAAAAYALNAGGISGDAFWPWTLGGFKPDLPRRNLIKAAALIVAEIERIDRAESKGHD